MHDVVFVEHLECFQQLPKDRERIGFLQFGFLPEEILQGASITELVNDVIVVLGLDDFVVADDVVRDPDGGQRLYLVRDVGLELVVFLEFLNGDDFNGEVPWLRLVGGPVD